MVALPDYSISTIDYGLPEQELSVKVGDINCVHVYHVDVSETKQSLETEWKIEIRASISFQKIANITLQNPVNLVSSERRVQTKCGSLTVLGGQRWSIGDLIQVCKSKTNNNNKIRRLKK